MYGRIDWDDRAVGAVFLLCSAIAVGLVTVPGTTWFSDPLITLGPSHAPADFSPAKIGSMVALGITVATNRTDFSKLTGVEMWAAIVTFGLVIAPPISPFLDWLIGISVVGGLFAVLIQAGGFAIIAYLG